MQLSLEEVLTGIRPVEQAWRVKARKRLDDLAIPRDSLGCLLDLAEQLAGIKESMMPSVAKKMVVTMAGDHGVVAEGVSAFPQEVTPQMVNNIVAGGAAINVLAEAAGVGVTIVDMGVAVDLSSLVEQKKILSYKVAYGTQNIAKGPAMTREQAVQALEAGIEVAGLLMKSGIELLGTGDMGIGNTTPSSAILAAFSGRSPRQVTGRGTGLNDSALENKIKVIEKAIAINKPDGKDALDVLAKVGGFEIAGIAGLILGAAYYRVPVVVDGLISSAGALVAKNLAPDTVDYMIAAHQSMEPGHQYMLEVLGLKPILNLNLRLGEGTGAALAMNIVETASRVIYKMLTFTDAGVTGPENTEGMVHA
ncbi:nicotinate-nucleotide--dimethylbenzimidazole phosphoribosyltransferase [Desulfosporosinus orientis DSM 765]|uniref:Nicotinate-nucleotide--dimethylbenzimidazole phosphoribosyltransferase n=1 Tax=Desulfosporosinus orientis (strain ATCC 19365 / DSM 765 / NCIMB 8382 / VKM B-1628 / Singapore I) TaxID=768706 RepID=G7WGH2_DESOD|nr:nicotinate-nucleotide--dimethylbenzimidazole phosphoribosyltransferase [Desulfosporosinus orientis]AET68049.1 nicotinate-nucleotide--dimethylbenzimidazole phosphoribosyltransferase [Desulfosporosinus orientis DSM 765]